MGEFRRNMQDLVNNPRGYLEMIADRLQNASKGRRAVANREGLGYRDLTQEERAQQMTQAVLDNLGGGGLGIIKAKGGNWLTGSVENALKGLKPTVETHRIAEHLGLPDIEAFRALPQEQRRAAAREVLGPQKLALSNWIEGPLTKYVKRDMATEGDPVRKLAEQGVLHIQPDMTALKDLSMARKYAGFESQPTLTRPESQYWNNKADSAIRVDTAKEILDNDFPSGYPDALKHDPWLSKVDHNTPVYGTGSIPMSGLGFQHLTDELANALNPESGLPRHLQLTPEQMQQLGMEKAVRHVDAINKWRAAQKAEANAKLAQSPAVHMVREYAENNPKGLRWVELKQPEAKTLEELTPTQREWYQDYLKEGVSPEGALRNAAKRDKSRLQEQLKYEGDTMGHCVGGYCDDVAGGRSRIFSLRDAKGEPHVTIETRPVDRDWGAEQYKWATENPEVYAEFKQKFPNLTDQDREFRRMFAESQTSPTQHIVQIKGKQNLKPKDEYLPFVQDFVRNHPEGGKWGDIGDLQNTGLRRTRDAWNDMEQARIREAGHEIPDYLSIEEIQQLGEKVWPGQWGKTNYAQGGSVQGNTTWRPMELDGIIGYITE